MRPGRRFSALSICSLLVAVACGGDDDGGASPPDAAASADANTRPDGTPEIDATPADLACLGAPLPTEADDPVTVSGMVFTIAGFQETPVEDVIVEARRVDDDSVLDDNRPGGTPDEGTFSLSAGTAGDPLLAYLYVTKAGNLPTRLYPPAPVTSNLSEVPVPLLDELLLTLLASDQEEDMGIVLVVVVDCSGNEVQGATVSADPAVGQIVYGDDSGFPDQAATSTGARGLAFLINAPVGELEVNATASGEQLLAHDVETVAGEVTATVVLPGPLSL